MSELKSNDKSLFDRLYDENDGDPIVLTDENGKKISFEQIAIIPHGDYDYCILAPSDSNQVEGLAEDEAVVFRIGDEEDEQYITVEDDEEIAEAVFEKYLKLLDEDE